MKSFQCEYDRDADMLEAGTPAGGIQSLQCRYDRDADMLKVAILTGV